MNKDKKPDNPYAFPLMGRKKDVNNFHFQKGMDLLDYFITHAPSTPQWDFDVPMDTKMPVLMWNKEKGRYDNTAEVDKWYKERKEKEAKMWPAEWAYEQLKQREKYL